MIPAWYGMGTALAELAEKDRDAWQQLRAMYKDWPFLQATIDNAALALAKADMYIAGKYAELSEDADAQKKLWGMIARERDRTRKVILDLVEGDELLSNTPWLQSSIAIRNPHIDPLNLIQIELLRRKRKAQAANDEKEHERLRALLRLTVQGVAAGMRTTG
jgi:phosphoenolpyruvate carboxylase